MTDLHALIHRMANELDRYRQILHDDRSPYHPLAVEARAALAQQEPQPVADGEVGELVKWLRRVSNRLRIDEFGDEADRAALAADLLERLSPLQPIPVSERLPGPEDLDAESRCWWFNPGVPAMSNPHIATSSWRLTRMIAGKAMGSHWLPSHALPLPTTTENTDD